MREKTLGSLFDGIGELDCKWKPIAGYEDEYLISNYGDIWSMRSCKILKPKKQKSGYLRIGLSVDGLRKDFSVHRLVAKAFIPNPSGKLTVNHKNEIKTDNHVENLEWATHAEQNNHGTRTQRARKNTDYKKRELNINRKALTKKIDYKNITEKNSKKVVQKKGDKIIAEFSSMQEASRKTGVSASKICMCCKGQRKTSGGWRWEYGD